MLKIKKIPAKIQVFSEIYLQAELRFTFKIFLIVY